MIYVTGAAGFIGSHLVDKLKSTEGVICCDIRDKEMLQPQDLIQKFREIEPSIIYHLGAVSSTTESDTRQITFNNVLFSCQILEYCIENRVPMVYASSASVYGVGKYGFEECAQMTPLNYYAISKSSFDSFVLQKLKDNPLAQIYGLRYFNVYGTNEEHKKDMASPVHKFLKQAKEENTIKIFKGSEGYFRDFIHVDDIVDITIAASTLDEPGIYNAGTGTPSSFMQVAKIVAELTGASIIEIPFPEILKSKYQEYTCSDNTKIKTMGYSLDRISIEEGIKKVALVK
jgi:ADP-L-glycero-D-manno-heptose 6-epimerase